jgi:uncharacterized protein YggE
MLRPSIKKQRFTYYERHNSLLTREKAMLKKSTAATIVLTLLAGYAFAEPPPRTVTVTARGEVRVTPDLAELSLGVVTQAAVLADAKRENDKKTAAILVSAKNLGVKPEDILLNVTIRPIYEEKKSEIDKLAAYRIFRDIEFRLRDFEKIEPLLTEALAGGANVVHGLEYRYTKHGEQQTKVRQLAVEAAREKARQLAELNGLKLGKAIQISEDPVTNPRFEGAPAMPSPPAALPRDDQRSPVYLVNRRPNPDDVPPKGGKQPGNENVATVPFAPGQLAVQIVVTATFELDVPK